MELLTFAMNAVLLLELRDLDGNRGCVMGLRCFYHSYAPSLPHMCAPPVFISPDVSTHSVEQGVPGPGPGRRHH